MLSVVVPVQSSVKCSQIYSQLRNEAVKTTHLIMIKKTAIREVAGASRVKCLTSEISAPFAFGIISKKCVNGNSYLWYF